jgi:hypothetical protein
VVRVANLSLLLCCPIMFLRSEFRFVMSVAICECELCSVRPGLQLFVGGLMSDLRYLCLFVYKGPTI